MVIHFRDKWPWDTQKYSQHSRVCALVHVPKCDSTIAALLTFEQLSPWTNLSPSEAGWSSPRTEWSLWCECGWLSCNIFGFIRWSAFWLCGCSPVLLRVHVHQWVGIIESLRFDNFKWPSGRDESNLMETLFKSRLQTTANVPLKQTHYSHLPLFFQG